MYQDGAKYFSGTRKSFGAGSAYAGFATYDLSRTVQAYDGLDTGISEETLATAGV